MERSLVKTAKVRSSRALALPGGGGRSWTADRDGGIGALPSGAERYLYLSISAGESFLFIVLVSINPVHKNPYTVFLGFEKSSVGLENLSS